MWAKLPKKRQVLLAVVSFVVIMLSSTAIGLLFNQQSQPQAEDSQQKQEQQAKKEEQLRSEELLSQAKNEYYRGDYQASIDKYQQVINKFNSSRARANLAAIYQEQGQYQLALEQYQKLTAETDNPDYRLSLAIAYYNTGQLKSAQQEFKSLINAEDIDNDYLFKEAHYYLFLLARQDGELATAKKELQQALEHKKWALGYYHLGEIEYEEGSYQQAVNYYQTALSMDESLKGVNKKLGLAYLKLEHSKDAAKYLRKAKDEVSNDQVVNRKVAQLKDKYPEYFKHDPTKPPTRESIPKEVNFKDIKALQNPGQELHIGIMTQQPRIFARVGSEFEVVRNGQVVATGDKGELIAATTEGSNQLEIGTETFSLSTPITIRPTSYAPILVHQVEYGAGYYWGGRVDMQYRGQLELRVVDGGLTAINTVPLESYLMAVVPSEMSASWPLEALKVQSVAARSYTLANLDKHSRESYDLCSTVHCAAYRGINREHARTNQAVKETAGEIMTYNDRPINAVYSANSGGHTENSEDVWNFAVPYLKAVSTQEQHPEFPLPPAELKEWLQEVPDSYSQDNRYTKDSHYRWQRELSVEYLEPRLGVAEIKEIIASNRGTGGSVEAVIIKGAQEEKTIKSGLRYKFGGLRSNRFWIQPQYQDGELSSFIFYGGGWGHNVGMDQVAVASMADNGYGYREILKHFYTGIEFGNSDE
ncbi:SpoIID/LytB domain-containing protein [Halanaerobacter jeridensis]|uniref:SpoIID/LytB domain protein n=1 Tax=Halanaerobacter jeridensis TaxID=706427 RepID=A0A939BQE8_9FIRM|nr:SpoIID/LytB domain-containing protein [Halanaerobacter jeridensis]MBM7558068.1 SpoIID/LytB domain protein [Halanaerobacter jeridensis]